MGPALRLVACLSAVACLAAAAQAGPLVISVNFGADNGECILNPGDAAGVIPAMNWNNVYGPCGSASLYASDGTTPAGTVSCSSSGDDYTTGPNLSPPTPDSTMMYGYLDAGSNSGSNAATITFSGLPAVISAGFNVYVYVAGDMGTSGAEQRIGDYTIGGTTIWAMQGSSTSAFSLASSGTAGNYIEFTGVSGSGFSLVAAASSFRAGRRHSDRAGVGATTPLDRFAEQRVEHQRHQRFEELAGR